MNTREKYINAVFNFDSEAFKGLLQTEPFDPSLLTDIEFAYKMPCPIYWITQCWEIVFANPEEWVEEVQSKIAENKRRNLEIKELFSKEFAVSFQPIDFYNTDFYFYRNERDATFDKVILGESRDNLIAEGYHPIDLDLFVAVCKFDYSEVKRLLELGANPRCEITEEKMSCFSRITTECSSLEYNLQRIFLNQENGWEDFSVPALIDLLGLAAHESMYSLLSQYDFK